MKNKSFMSNIKFDLPAGLVVFFVALPLCLGISLASTSYSGIEGIEDFAGIVMPGIIAGIIGGIVVGSFSGSKFGVSGPAAGLITIIAAAIIEFGGFGNGGYEKFALAVLLGGIIQTILGFLKAGLVAYYIPFSVIKGMLAGIGVTILIKEIPHFFGYDKNPEGDLSFNQVDGHNPFEDLSLMTDNIHVGATLVGLISLIILILWGQKFIKKSAILNLIPGPLVAIVASILMSFVMIGNSDLLIAAEHLVSVPTPSSFDEFSGMFYFPDFSAITDYKVWTIAITIAIVASIESLLCVEATDKMDPHKGRTPMSRELVAQGIGNVISGLLGGLPITQVIVRSSANIDAGAKSKNSAIIHGILLLIFVLAIPGLLNMIPRATLAAVLLLIGWKLASPKSIIAMVKAGWTQYVPFFVVVVVMLLTDLLIGVGAGMVIAFLIILYTNFKMSFFMVDKSHPKELHLKLSQHTTFLNKASIMKGLDSIEDGSSIEIDLSDTISIDYDVSEAIRDFEESAEDRGITVKIIHEEKLIQISMSH